MEDKLISVLKILFCIACLLGGISWYLWKHPQPVKLAYDRDLGNVNVEMFDDDMANFLQRYYPVGSKKIVLYESSLTQANCPYIKEFVKAFQIQKSRVDLYPYYDFISMKTRFEWLTESEMKREAPLVEKIFAKCGPVCVVDVKRRWLYSLVPEKASWLNSAAWMGKKLDVVKDK